MPEILGMILRLFMAGNLVHKEEKNNLIQSEDSTATFICITAVRWLRGYDIPFEIRLAVSCNISTSWRTV